MVIARLLLKDRSNLFLGGVFIILADKMMNKYSYGIITQKKR